MNKLIGLVLLIDFHR